MALKRLLRELRSSVDAFDFFFALLPGLTGYAAFVTWTEAIVRAIRGEEVTDADRKLGMTSAVHVGARALSSATHARESVGVHQAVAEMRELLREAAADAEARDKRAAAEAATRDKRAAAREDKLYKINVAMAVLAGCTLVAAIVTLIVTIIN